jgi:ATP-dependent DNA helicase RecG
MDVYGSYNPIQIKVFPDRVYIFNSCRFPDKWTAKTLFRTHDSVRVNPNIASAIFWTGMIETWGRGIAKIVAGCKRIGAPEPVYEILPRNMSLKFEAPFDGVYRGIADGSDKTAMKISDSETFTEYLTETFTENLTEKELEVIRLIAENREWTTTDMSKRLGVSRQTVAARIKTLKQKNIIRREGSDTKGHWEIIRHN